MDSLVRWIPVDDSNNQFMDTKCVEDKPYYIYMSATSKKFLLIHYGWGKEYLASSEATE